MSNSRKKNPFGGYNKKESEKQCKQRASRRLRRAVRQASLTGDEVLPVTMELTNPYSMSKDGKQYLHTDCYEYEKLMRK
jgi:hypothetical protein